MINSTAESVVRTAPKFEQNRHGHIVFTLEGLSLYGDQEIERLTTAQFLISPGAKSCLLSTAEDSYNQKHRLQNKQYQVALMPTREIKSCERTIDGMHRRSTQLYGYKKPLAGVVPRIREAMSNAQMTEMGFSFIAAPHDLIIDLWGNPCVLGIWGGKGRGQCLNIFATDLDEPWKNDGAFAYFDPERIRFWFE